MGILSLGKGDGPTVDTVNGRASAVDTARIVGLAGP